MSAAVVNAKRLDALRVATPFTFAGKTWMYVGKNRGAGGLSNVLDPHGAKTMLPAATLVEPFKATHTVANGRKVAVKPAPKSKPRVRR